MKASELKPGDVMDGWTVAVVEKTAAICWSCEVPLYHARLVLLDLEGTYYLEGHDVNGEEIWWLAPAPEGEPTKTETRRTWYQSDEEVEVMR